MIQNYFQGTTEHPYHISIGAIVRNTEGKICCHYFDSLTIRGKVLENFYLLMRETIEPNESIEICLARGLMEEFGMKAELKSYIGSIVSSVQIRDTDIFIEKTTLYFLCDFISLDETLRRKEDAEAESVITWVEAHDLISKMKEQGIRMNRSDADESSILERVLAI